MALTAEAAGDASKRQDALALRLQPLQSLLSYDLEDRSERLFEASIAAELLRSVLSVNFADTLTDFILSEHEELSGLCDQRVVAATKKLRAMIQADRQRTTTTTATAATASTAATTADSGVTDQDTADKTMDTEVTYVVDGSGSSATTSATVDSTSSTNVTAADGDSSGVVAHTDSTTTAAAEGKEAPTEQTTEPIQEQSTTAVVADTQQHCSDGGAQDNVMEMTVDSNTESMCETEARLWRKRFVSAARWFDKTEEMCLHYEHLKLILHSSTRNLSRADVEDALERVCTKDILRYESFV